MSHTFPDFIRALPQPAARLPLKAYLIPSDQALAMFYEAADRDVEVPVHTHGDQWGIVVSGEVELHIDGERHTLSGGDSYFVPAGVPHAAVVRAGASGIDFFSDHDRYLPRSR